MDLSAFGIQIAGLASSARVSAAKQSRTLVSLHRVAEVLSVWPALLVIQFAGKVSLQVTGVRFKFLIDALTVHLVVCQLRIDSRVFVKQKHNY